VTQGLSVEQLCFSWRPGRPILKNCSFSLPPGQLWMLLGSNGSGKSTLLKLLAGVIEPDSGHIRFDPPLGLVFQNPDHQLVMPTVGADVAFGLGSEGLSFEPLRARVGNALKAVGLEGYENRPIYALSGGQKQRVAIAGAIARNCPVLLLDEPTALLDPDSQRELVQLVQRLVRQQGLTALWVTHRLEELDACDGALLLENGELIDQGDPQRLRARIEA
jgi:energy-coupling factor transport system ATP-binding protein